jgi:hypothetical protein
MAWTSQEEKRIVIIEEMLNSIQMKLNSLTPKTQLSQLLNAKQTEVNALTNKIASLEAIVTNLMAALQIK